MSMAGRFPARRPIPSSRLSNEAPAAGCKWPASRRSNCNDAATRQVTTMTSTSRQITIRRPDDWHVHLRDGAMMAAVLPYTARQFARAIVMPNLVPPVTDVATARAYRERILAALPAGADFAPLMTCYLTDTTDPREVARGYEEEVFAAVKL